MFVKWKVIKKGKKYQEKLFSSIWFIMTKLEIID